MVCDLVGLRRGAATCAVSGLVNVPTTLLAQVDASVGGKTGVNHARGKNLIGAFYQPLCVVADTSLLATLSPRAFAAGMAEVAKMAMILDADLFESPGKRCGQRSSRQMLRRSRRSSRARSSSRPRSSNATSASRAIGCC